MATARCTGASSTRPCSSTSRRSPSTWSALLLALAVVHSQGQGSIDEGTLLVRQDTVEVAREAFRLTPARAAAGSWTLATTIRYDRTRPVVVLDPILELGPDSVATTLEY